MIKSICSLLVLFSTLIINGQNAILLKNFNPKAEDLKHSLNSTKDSLILEYKKAILNVEIFNEDYEKLIPIENSQAQISLSDLPAGKFVINTILEDKTIVMGLLKRDPINNANTSKVMQGEKEIAEGKGMMLDESLNVIKRSPKHSIEYILTRGKSKKHAKKSQKFFWVSLKVNNESGSSRTMRLVNKETVEKMIFKNKKEHNNPTMRFNELTVWEVYNTTKFMELQMANSDFINSTSSEYFNVIPYYKSENNSNDL